MVYARNLGSGTFSFQVSGRLWRNSLIMQDRGSDTWWSQVTGRAIHGANKGALPQKLELSAKAEACAYEDPLITASMPPVE